MQWQTFIYNDICLDMGGERNFGDYRICVVDLEALQKKISAEMGSEFEEKYGFPPFSRSLIPAVPSRFKMMKGFCKETRHDLKNLFHGRQTGIGATFTRDNSQIHQRKRI